MAGYIRTDVTDQIANGNTVDAIPLDAEFNGVEAAFAAVGGHKHDGSVGEGAPITVAGPAQDLVVSGTSVTPKTDNTLDLGSTTKEFKDLWIDGVANIDSLVADTADINGGTVDATVIGATTPAAATITTLAATTATVGGDTVTTNTAVQTLTNKTVNLTSNTLVATSAQIAAAVTDETGTGALVFAGSPALTGTPTAPTAAAATNTTQIATTAHVFAERSNTATLTNKTLTSPVISGGTITGITDLAIADGGTGSSTAAGALTNFGLTATAAEINFNSGVTSAVQTQLNAKQPLDTELTAIAGLVSAADRLPYFTGSGTAALATFTAFGRSLVEDADAATARATLELGSTNAVTFGSVSTGLLVSKNADFTVGANENTFQLFKGSTLIVTLPSAASFPGRRLRFRNLTTAALISASSNVTPLLGGSPQTAILPAIAGAWCDLQSDGANWHVVCGGFSNATASDARVAIGIDTGGVLGAGQTWQNVIGSRAVSTSYQNTTGRPIQVYIDANSSVSTGRDIEVSVDNATWVKVAQTNGSAGGFVSSAIIVPNNHYYRVNGAVASLKNWGELR